MKVLITGSRSGIAFLTGITLASRGHFVYMTTHTLKEAHELKKRVDRYNYKIIVFRLDVTNVDDRKILDTLDVDVLINHAGIGVGGSVLDLPLEELKRNFEVNYFYSYDIVKRVVNKMIKNNKEGRIIITSSIAGTIPIPFLGSYCSTKSAISTMATSLRGELKTIKSKIKIILIEPGAYKTGFNQVIIDDIDKNTNSDSVFFNEKDKIHNSLTNIFNLTEKKKLNSIVIKIIEAVESSNPRSKYSAPLVQKIFAKIYTLFCK